MHAGSPSAKAPLARFDVQGFLKSAGVTPRIVLPKRDMIRTLHERSEFSDRFLVHMLARDIRIEEDLVDQLFNSSEKRLARTLLLLAQYGKEDTALRPLPKLSQETLAEMVGLAGVRWSSSAPRACQSRQRTSRSGSRAVRSSR